MEFLRVFASLVLVLGLLGGLLWGLKRLQLRMLPGGPAGRRMQVLDSLSVGPRQRVALVRVGTQDVLVGVSPGQMTALGSWPAASDEAAASAPTSLEVEHDR